MYKRDQLLLILWVIRNHAANQKEEGIILNTHTVHHIDETVNLRNQLERTQALFVSATMEKNFLQRAMADLNFHHNAHDGIVFTNTKNEVVYANPYFLKMMNVADPKEVLNKPLPSYMWFDPTDSDRLFADVREFGFVRERDLNLYNQDKAPVFVACSAVTSKDDEDNIVGTEIMLCNVTSKRKIQTELADRTETLERITEFCRHSFDHLQEVVQRGAPNSEVLALIEEVKGELAKL